MYLQRRSVSFIKSPLVSTIYTIYIRKWYDRSLNKQLDLKPMQELCSVKQRKQNFLYQNYDNGTSDLCLYFKTIRLAFLGPGYNRGPPPV